MLANIQTVTFIGVEARPIDIQVHLANSGLPCFNIVGLPNKAVAESKERVRAAFASIGLGMPNRRITVNLAPADLLKEGSHFDLGIAVGLLIAMQIIPQEELSHYVTMGELALDGVITKVNGVLPAAIYANSVDMGIICPQSNGVEAAWSGNETIIAPSSLLELIKHFTGQSLLVAPKPVYVEEDDQYLDLQDVKYQRVAKRALEIAAAGNHNMIMVGPPGSGKSMLAKRLPGIMPKMTTEEKLEASIIASIAGQLKYRDGLVHHRPFRDPHCSSSMPSMVGGGKNASPGEITLAHLGVLFLDELPEFNRITLEALRQPVEDGKITIARVGNHISYPSKFLLIAAMNPCKCGYFGYMKDQECRRVPRCGVEYQERISGPLFDRFDLQVRVEAIDPLAITNDRPEEAVLGHNFELLANERKENQEEKSIDIAARVAKARMAQRERFVNEKNISTNADLEGELLKKFIVIDDAGFDLLKRAVSKFNMSMRGVYRVMKVARTIADLNQQEKVNQLDVAEALQYRIARMKE